MYTTLISALTLAASAIAAPTLQTRQETYRQTNPFRLHAAANANLTGYSITNAHIAAATNALVLSPPNITVSNCAVLNGTTEQFDSDSTRLVFLLDVPADEPNYEVVLPDVQQGDVGLVTAQLGPGDATFTFGGDNYIETAGGASLGYIDWYACHTPNMGIGDVLTLWYGAEVKEENLPTSECYQIELQATFDSS